MAKEQKSNLLIFEGKKKFQRRKMPGNLTVMQKMQMVKRPTNSTDVSFTRDVPIVEMVNL